MFRTNRRAQASLLVGVVSLLVGVACGGSTSESGDTSEPSETSNPLVGSISLGTSESQAVRNVAESSWSRVIEGLEEGQYSPVFESGGALFGLVNTVEPGEPVEGEPFSLMSWNGSQWVNEQGLGAGTCFFPSECSIGIHGDGETEFPIVALYWCCPMGGGAYRTDQMTSVYVVRDGRIKDLLPSGDNQFWPISISANYFEADSCVSGEVAYLEQYGYEDLYCYRARTTRYLVENGEVVDQEITEYDIPDNPFETCIWYVGERCMELMYVESTEDCSLADIAYADRFPLVKCQYGYWMLEFEENLFADGFAVNVDGFYLPSEVATVTRAQQLAGLSPDGKIGPATWKRFVDFSVCIDSTGIGGMPNDFVSCDFDDNDDGLYGPGDIVPH